MAERNLFAIVVLFDCIFQLLSPLSLLDGSTRYLRNECEGKEGGCATKIDQFNKFSFHRKRRAWWISMDSNGCMRLSIFRIVWSAEKSMRKNQTVNG